MRPLKNPVLKMPRPTKEACIVGTSIGYDCTKQAFSIGLSEEDLKVAVKMRGKRPFDENRDAKEYKARYGMEVVRSESLSVPVGLAQGLYRRGILGID